MAWSTVHGLAMLLIDGPLRSLPDTERQALVERTVRYVRDGICPP
jgi:hypothetical protein